MAWVRLEDGFFTHPKAMMAGKDGRALFIAALCWCCANRTDGRVPKAALRVLAMAADVKSSAALAVARAGLWDEDDDAYVIHDYLDYNDSRSVVEDRREQWRKSKRRSRDVRAGHSQESGQESGQESEGESTQESCADSRWSPHVDKTRQDNTYAYIPTTTTTTDAARGRSSSSSSSLYISVLEEAARIYGVAQAAKRQASNPKRFALGVARNVLIEQKPQLDAYMAEHPDTDAEALAIAVLGCTKWDLIDARRPAP